MNDIGDLAVDALAVLAIPYFGFTAHLEPIRPTRVLHVLRRAIILNRDDAWRPGVYVEGILGGLSPPSPPPARLLRQ